MSMTQDETGAQKHNLVDKIIERYERRIEFLREYIQLLRSAATHKRTSAADRFGMLDEAYKLEDELQSKQYFTEQRRYQLKVNKEREAKMSYDVEQHFDDVLEQVKRMNPRSAQESDLRQGILDRSEQRNWSDLNLGRQLLQLHKQQGAGSVIQAPKGKVQKMKR